ncbi:formate dehydrogenase accessory sulfurtransferase FdhD [Leptolyngbya sp. 7M]|uniref:formate dehydrogenase accessory sulfurtransferase FdhD n=1 Tax=Leptolyngbya sp. 7M TaxID=2812896 RepID=UPI001B8CE685|nr:formate dehydrogenase accessory sulfurtransferase FdhD [Leptolyngbya sp. 7M]QYO65874.1 formate dehydrogenase accessory sulfurtransferase FdhD [Leptolyngbya sp. 7M]
MAVRSADGREFRDKVAVEEPLEIRLGLPDGTHKAVSITMRTPGEDAELAAGFLFTEGIIKSPEQIKQIRHCGLKIGKVKGALDRVASLNSNTIRVDLSDNASVDLKKLERHFYTTSSCGVCGKSSIDALRSDAKPIDNNGLEIAGEVVNSLPDELRKAQSAFERTGGLHASALFDASGEIDIIREDVGRHNALDKVIGKKFLDGELPQNNAVLLVSGRASFELVQKGLMAGIPIMAAVGAPSSLAVELAKEYGMTLVGFVRDGRFNIYSGDARIRLRSHR